MKRRMLFICWDGPQVNYLEGLFLPIFRGLRSNIDVYIIQFSWAGVDKVSSLEKACEAAGITYVHFPVSRRPHPSIGTLITLYKGSKFIQDFVQQNDIEVIMPRSTLPAAMALPVLQKLKHLKMIFDADGLPLEERVDFAGLDPNGLQYKLLKSFETRTINQANVVITRTEAAINYLTKDHPFLRKKFFKVTNGRDIDFFKEKNQKEAIRKRLGIESESLVLVYAGSLGPQYCVPEMLKLYHEVSKFKKETNLLILTGNIEFLNEPAFSKLLDENVKVKNVPFQEVPDYLGAADIALAIREPTFSMKGVAPIKIGEYLLTKLPVVASAGIGDTEEILKNERSCFVLRDHDKKSLEAAASWILQVYNQDIIKEEARNLGIREFSLEKSLNTYQVAIGQLN